MLATPCDCAASRPCCWLVTAPLSSLLTASPARVHDSECCSWPSGSIFAQALAARMGSSLDLSSVRAFVDRWRAQDRKVWEAISWKTGLPGGRVREERTGSEGTSLAAREVDHSERRVEAGEGSRCGKDGLDAAESQYYDSTPRGAEVCGSPAPALASEADRAWCSRCAPCHHSPLPRSWGRSSWTLVGRVRSGTGVVQGGSMWVRAAHSGSGLAMEARRCRSQSDCVKRVNRHCRGPGWARWAFADGLLKTWCRFCLLYCTTRLIIV